MRQQKALPEGPVTETVRSAIRDWDEVCDLDFRCPEYGRWPRTWDEYAQWAWKHARGLVESLRPLVPEATE